MDDNDSIGIEVACAWPDRQIIRLLRIPKGTTVRQALRLSGLAEEVPAIDVDTDVLGVFGRVVADSHEPRAGDRIEVYRPLLRDPREARRLRAESLAD